MGRGRGDGAWIERAQAFAARRSELSAQGVDSPIARLAEEAGMTQKMMRRYLEALSHVEAASGALTCRISLNALEVLRALGELDPARYEDIVEPALRGEVTLAEIQQAVRDARIRDSIPDNREHLSTRAIIGRFRDHGEFELPADDEEINIPARGPSWLHLSADLSGSGSGESAAHAGRHHEWALLLSPNMPRSPLRGRTFSELLLHVAAANRIYDHVGVFCASRVESEQVREAAELWSSAEENNLTLLY